MPPLRIYTLTPAEVATIRQEIAIPPANAGAFRPPDHQEVDLGYVWDGVSKLKVTILDDAWYETAGEVFDALDKYMPAGSLPTP
jgi:hypothetical protein